MENKSVVVIKLIGNTELTDIYNDNIDVFVYLDNKVRYSATFFTITNIDSIMKRYALTGECGNGLYFWASNMIIVRDLSMATIEATIGDLLLNNEFFNVFAGPFYDII